MSQPFFADDVVCSQVDTLYLLICESLDPGRLQWYVLGTDGSPLVRGFVDCSYDFSRTEKCIDLVRDAAAMELGITVDQLALVDHTIKPLSAVDKDWLFQDDD